jgi:hypothetical protein
LTLVAIVDSVLAASAGEVRRYMNFYRHLDL